MFNLKKLKLYKCQKSLFVYFLKLNLVLTVGIAKFEYVNQIEDINMQEFNFKERPLNI